MARKLKLAQRRGPQTITPAAEIAMYIKRDTGLVISPEVIRDFVAGRFVTLSVLAHEIHAAAEAEEMAAKQAAARRAREAT